MQKKPNSTSCKTPMPTIDPQVAKATAVIRSLFEDKYHRPRKKAFFIGQLQLHLEGQFFQWIVYNAITELLNEGYLKQKQVTTKYADKARFTFHHGFTEKQMDTRTKNVAKLIDRYSTPRVADALGKHLEGLVKAELRARDFIIVASHTNEYRGRKWEKTRHDLDLVAEHKSQQLSIGVEVKNTLSVPEREEIETKIELCKHLGLRPVFAARWIQPYIKLVNENEGYCWMFRTQIYPPGFEQLTKAVWNRLRLPVTVRTELPEKPTQRFQDWVNKNTTQPKS